jgi:hypothetical protein
MKKPVIYSPEVREWAIEDGNPGCDSLIFELAQGLV